MVSQAQQLRLLCNSFDHSSCSILIYHSGFFPTVEAASSFDCGCFCWALAPFSLFALSGLLSLTKRKSGWGICGSSVVVVRFLCVVTWMLHMYMTTESCTYFYFLDASLSVRTDSFC